MFHLLLAAGSSPSSLQMDIHLKARQFEYLRSLATLFPDTLVRALEEARKVTPGTYCLFIPREMAKEFGDSLTYYQARVGFDSEYKLTDEGRMLEDLIDRFRI
ncbi:MAG TPA: hypothetical protein VFW45_12825 [Candidatus Polarisedimenticolia bacterium]|nr:hypothetical protein [Candidatus Polarisedimenticolia bacterium]